MVDCNQFSPFLPEYETKDKKAACENRANSRRTTHQDVEGQGQRVSTEGQSNRV